MTELTRNVLGAKEKTTLTIGFNAKSRCWVLKCWKLKCTPHLVRLNLGKHHMLDFHCVQVSKVKSCECCDVCAIRDAPWNGFGAILRQSWDQRICQSIYMLVWCFWFIHSWWFMSDMLWWIVYVSVYCLILLEGCTKCKRQGTPFFVN